MFLVGRLKIKLPKLSMRAARSNKHGDTHNAQLIRDQQQATSKDSGINPSQRRVSGNMTMAHLVYRLTVWDWLNGTLKKKVHFVE